MKRLLPLVLLVLVAGTAWSQSPRKPEAPQENGFMSWVHDAWKTVQEEGKPAAERFVRQWPKRFQDMKGTVAGLSKKAHDSIDAMDLEQKKNLLLELWRVRKSLDLLTLLNPETRKL